VFCAGEYESIRDARLAPDVTGVTMLVDWTAGVELALRLHPGLDLHLGFDGTGNRDIEIGGGKFQAIIFRPQQDIGQDGKRGSCADHILNRLQPADDLVLGDGQVHASC